MKNQFLKKKILRRIEAICLILILGIATIFPTVGISSVKAGTDNEACTLDFALCDYTAIEIGENGWKTGSTTKNVSVSGGVLSGQTGETSDPSVLTLDVNAAANRFTMEAGTEYRFSVTYKSAARLMFFCDNWIAVQNPPEASAEWKTISVTFTAGSSGKLPIYIQNWGGDTPTGEFQIKDMYIAKVSDSKNLITGDAIGAIPEITQAPGSEEYKMIWMANGIEVTSDGTYSKDMGTVAYVKEILKADDTVTLDFAQYDYTTVPIGADGWKTGSTAKNVSISNGILSGETGDTKDPSVLTLEVGSSGNQFVMEAGTEYRFSVTYKSAARLMFFCDNWIAVQNPPEASAEWKTISVTFTAGSSGKLPIYIQNWGGDTPIGEFQMKDMYIAKVSDARTVKEGIAVGNLPVIAQTPSSDEYRFGWFVNDLELTVDTLYSLDMGHVAYPKEVAKVVKYTGQFEFVQYDYTSVGIGGEGWQVGSTTANVSNKDGVISGQTGDTSDPCVLTLNPTDANKFLLESGTEYRFCVTYKSSAKLMFFCENWVAVQNPPEAAEDWKTISVCFTAGSNGRMPIYIQNWGGTQPVGEFQIKDMYILKIGDTKTVTEDEAIGILPTITLSSSDEYHKMIWSANGTEITEGTIYEIEMGSKAYAREVEAKHNLQLVEGKEADCKNDGWMDYYTCVNTDCNQGNETRFYYNESSQLISFTDFEEWKTTAGKIPSNGGCSYTIYDSDETHHWMICSNCFTMQENSKVMHTCEQEIFDEKFLKSEADCKYAQTYYKSCVCGYCNKTDEAQVFTVGTPRAHKWTGDDATVTEHFCEECDATQEHTYENDVCIICQYDISDAIQFVQYNYVESGISEGGWQIGKDTTDVTVSNETICGYAGGGADVLSLPVSEKNPYTLEKGVKYRLSLSYISEVQMMIFYDCGLGWISMLPEKSSAEEWKTIVATFTPETTGKLAIYIQNWDAQQPTGAFQLKEIYLSEISDAKVRKDGERLGTLPQIHRTANDSSHEIAWCVKGTKVSENTVYDSKTMGKVVYAAEVERPHGPNAHKWTSKDATVMEHRCSECDALEKHVYKGDMCTVCQFDMKDALSFVLYDYTSVGVGVGGWEVGTTTKNVTVSDGILKGTTGSTDNPAVLSLYQHSQMNPFTMEAGEMYRVSLTYKSDAALMFFCDEWKNFVEKPEASKEWKTITVTITPDVSRKLALYVQNWDSENPDGEFQIKDIYISKLSDSIIPKSGSVIGKLPEINYSPSDEYHEFVWRICNKDGNGYTTITSDTIYSDKTMGNIAIAEEIKAYHSILNYVRCDFMQAGSWTIGKAMKQGSFSDEKGTLKGTVRADTAGETLLSLENMKSQINLESGVEYKAIMTYKSNTSFGAFLNLKSNAWTEAPGQCLPSTENDWKTVSKTFKVSAGDELNGVLIQSWNSGEEYNFQIKDFCIVRADETRKFAANEKLGTIPCCENEDDVLGRYTYEWVVYKKNREAIALTSNQTAKNISAASDELGAIYAYERIQCVYHIDDGKEYGKAPTCTEEGWSSYWVCKICGRYFSDALCKEEITDLEAWKICDGKLEPIGHIHTTELLSLDGIIYYYCECNKLFKLDGETFVEVPITVLDANGEVPMVNIESQSEDIGENRWSAIQMIAAGAGLLVVVTGLVVLIIWKRQKYRNTKGEAKKE